jgi:GlpG protein
VYGQQQRRAPRDPARAALEAPVTVAVSAAAIVLSFMAWQGGPVRSYVLEPGTLAAQPWRALTTTLLHGGMVHLAFNLMWMWSLGTAVERAWGSLRTLAIYAFLGASASLAEYAYSGAAVGLSGVVYGLLGMLYFAQRADPRLAGSVPPGLVRAFVVWFFICIALSISGSLPAANLAHAAGAGVGALLGRAVLAVRRREALASLWGASPLLAAGGLAAAALVAPAALRTPSGLQADERRAVGLLAQGSRAEAIALLEALSKEDPGNVRVWHNLAYAYQQDGRSAEVLAALRSGYAAAGPEDRGDFAAMLAPALVRAAALALERGDYGSAVDAYREAFEINPDLEPELAGPAAWAAEGTGDRDAAVRWYRLMAKSPSQHGVAMEALERLGVVRRGPEADADGGGAP